MLTHLYFIREARDYSLRQIEYKCHLSKSTISKIERGHTIPRLDTVCKLAKAFRMKPTQLFELLVRGEPWAK